MTITITQLPSGYWHIRGRGPCNWAQPPHWPCSEEVLRAHAFPQASEEFFADALAEHEARCLASARSVCLPVTELPDKPS